MSCKVMYTCDHCGKEVSPYIGKQWKAGFLTVGPNIDDIHACSFDHLALALAKTFDIPLDASTLRLVTEKNEALEAARVAIVERDTMRARVAELEARMPANEVTNAERAQYEATIESQRKRIEELETSEAVLAERLTRIEAPAKQLVDIDNNLAEGRDVAVKASFHDSVMRPIEELRVHFGNVARAEKRGQTIFDWEVDRRKRAEKSRDEMQARVAELEKRLAELTTPVTIDGKTPGQVFAAEFLVGGSEAVRKLGRDTLASMERGADAVLRAFCQPSQTPQTNVEKALRRTWNMLGVIRADQATIADIMKVMAFIDDEIAKLEAKPASDVPACFLCGKGPGDHTMMTLESLPEQFEVEWCNGRRQNFGTEKPAWWDRQTTEAQPTTNAEAVAMYQATKSAAQMAFPNEPQAITLPTKPTKPLRDAIAPRDIIVIVEEPPIECDKCGQTNGSHALWCGT